MEVTINLVKADGQPAGSVTVPDFNAWTQLPPEVAVQVFNLADGWTPEMVLSGEVVALIKVTTSGPEYLVGKLIRPGESPIAISQKYNFGADSYVLRADGSVEH